MTARPKYLFLISLALIICIMSCGKKQSLYDIQRTLLCHQDKAPAFFVHAAHDYYQSQTVPDCIQRDIESRVQADLTKYASDTLSTWKDWRQKDNEQIDFEFSHLIEHLCAAKIRADSSAFLHYKKLGQQLAHTLSFESGNSFWSQWLPTVLNWKQTEALAYLKAQRADACCRSLYESMDKMEAAECYTSAALHYLDKISAPRLRLDISQRIIAYLHRTYGLYDLAVHMAAIEIPQAEKVHYTIRAVGLRYNAAMAMYKNGQNKNARHELQNILETIARNTPISQIADYKIPVILNGLIAVHFQDGDYAEVLKLCDLLDADNLPLVTQIKVTLYRALIAAELGDFDAAESLYQLAYSQAHKLEDSELLVTTLINMGDLKFNLDEPEMALALYDSAKQIIEKDAAFNNRQKVDIYLNMIEVYAKLGNQPECQKSLVALEEITRKMDNPRQRGVNLFNLGSLYIKTNEINRAEETFRQARDLFEQHGLDRQYLETMIEWTKSLLLLHENKQATEALAIIKEHCCKAHDALSIIEYYGLSGELFFAKGELTQAVEFSDTLWQTAKDVQGEISSITNLVLFNQRVYHYLKNAVLYEIERDQKDAAFMKLENAKAWALKRMYNHRDSGDRAEQVTTKQIQHSLPADGILVNYCIAKNRLFAFCLCRDDLQLLAMDISSDSLSALCSSFTWAIHQSSNGVVKGDPALIAADYQNCSQLANKLSTKLLTPQFQSLVYTKRTIYLVPDEILWDLPFCCLTLEDKSKTIFWIERSKITYLPSASFIAEYGATAVTESDLHRHRMIYSVDDNYRESIDICRYIDRTYPQAEYLRVHASPFHKDSVLAQLGKSKDMIIFFGHCQSNDLHPDLSFIRTSVYNSADSIRRTIELTLGDLKKVNWRDTDMIILMGCGTARGKLYKGSGLAGLQNGFLTLGASQVLATLWEIDSYHACLQLKMILEAVELGVNLEEALQVSQIGLINKLTTTIKYPHPFIWASYRVAQTKQI